VGYREHYALLLIFHPHHRIIPFMKNSEERRSKHGLSPRELRSSFLLPVVIALVIWLVGVVVYLIVPGEFNTAVSIIIGIALFAYLLYYTRHARPAVRLLALVFAVPAMVGIALSFSSGSARPLVIGVGITFLLLVVQRLLDTPVSYRVALRYFSQGRMDEALAMINKAVEARPDFWESQQLRALIHLTRLDFTRAEKDARAAIALRPVPIPFTTRWGRSIWRRSSSSERPKSMSRPSTWTRTMLFTITIWV
jgi:hypothetical protein